MTSSQIEMLKKLKLAIQFKRRAKLVDGDAKRDWWAVVIYMDGKEYEMRYQGTRKDCRWYRDMFIEQLDKYFHEPNATTQHKLGPKKPTKGSADRRNAVGTRTP